MSESLESTADAKRPFSPRGRWRRLVKTLFIVGMLFLLSWIAFYLYARKKEMYCRNGLAGTGAIIEVKTIGPSWLAGIIDRRYFETVSSVNLSMLQYEESVLTELECFPNLETLILYQTPITDEGLRYLKGLQRLRSLNLIRTHVVGPGLVHLREVPIEDLRLGPEIGDDTLRGVVELTSLKSLTIIKSPDITDEGIQCLRELSRLRLLRLEATGVTAEGEHRLKKELPSLTVVNSNAPSAK